MGEVFRLFHGNAPVVLEVFQNLDAIGGQAFPAPVIRHLRCQMVFLGFQGTQEERQPRQPVGGFLVECALGAAQGEVVAVLVALDDAFQRGVRHIAVTRLQQQQGCQHPRQSAIAVLEGVDGEEHHVEYADGQQRMLAAVFQRGACPIHQCLHFPWGVKRGGSPENHPKAFARYVEGFHMVVQGFVLPPVACVLVAVAEQHGVELFQVVFSQGNVVMALENGFHCVRVACYFLFITGLERLLADVTQQLFHFGITQLCPFNAGGRTDAFNGCHPAQGFQAFRGHAVDGFPAAPELVNLSNQLEHFGGDSQGVGFHALADKVKKLSQY